MKKKRPDALKSSLSMRFLHLIYNAILASTTKGRRKKYPVPDIVGSSSLIVLQKKIMGPPLSCSTILDGDPTLWPNAVNVE
jgi:hypothetical protein